VSGWGAGTWSSNYWGGVEDVLVAISGTSASGSVGDVVPTLSQTITGNLASGTLGTLGIGKAVVISGATASATTGSLSIVKSVNLTGNSAIGTVSNLGYYYWTAIDDTQTPNWTVITTF
jgi:hypothetical protein